MLSGSLRLDSELPACNSLRVMRVDGLVRYCRFLDAAGVDTERLLGKSGIPPVVLAYPRSLVAQSRAFRFGEFACRALGTEYLGLYVAERQSLLDLPVYGEVIEGLRTVGGYLIQGSRLFRMQSSAVRFEFERHGQMFRLLRVHAVEQGLGTYQSDLAAFALIISHLRKALGAYWSPHIVSFTYAPEEALPQMHPFGNARVVHGNAQAYLQFPACLLEADFPQLRAAGTANNSMNRPEGSCLPRLHRDLVALQLRKLLPGTDLGIETIAASLGLSPRSLQRHLHYQGVNFRELVASARLDAACDWLSTTDRSVTNISYDLGYSSPSNFTRAFRARTGLPPQTFREQTGRTGLPS